MKYDCARSAKPKGDPRSLHHVASSTGSGVLDGWGGFDSVEYFMMVDEIDSASVGFVS